MLTGVSRIKPSRTLIMRMAAIVCLSLAAMLAGPPGRAGDASTPPAAVGWQCRGAPLPRSITTQPTRRTEAAWVSRLQDKNRELAARQYDLAFLGDSITQRWTPGQWDALVGSHPAVNLGFNGDRTETLLWRLEHGHLDGKLPRAFVLLIGTNNIGRHHAPAAVADGVRAILELLRRRVPEARILLVAILPRDEWPNTPFRAAIAATNRLLAGCADDRTVFFVDPGPALLETDGRLSPAVAPDHLHLSERGYAQLGQAIASAIQRLF
jgi:beta-glucosidase